MPTFQILHISDPHITSKESFDRSVVLDPLIERIKEDHRSGLKPEIVIVTGDVAYSGVMPEHELAKPFFDHLLSSLDLGPDRLFIVPGNHDVNRTRYRPKDIPAYENMQELNHELENEGYRADLFKGMEDYFSFIKAHYPHLKSVHGNLVPFVNSYEAKCGKKIGLVGLNSAWMCRRSPDEREIAIGEYQVKKAMEELQGKGEYDLVLNIFHHPLSWLWTEDRKICRRCLNGSIVLSGHLHDAEAEYLKDLDGELCQFQAGTAYIGSEYPSRVQHITFDWSNSKIRVDYRKYVKDQRKWCVEGEKGDDGIGTFDMIGSTKKVVGAFDITPVIPEAYKNWLIDHCSYMDIDRLREKGDVIQVRLPEIFIPLYSYRPRKGSEGRSPQKEIFREKEDLVDIERLVAENDYLLIEGHPGSGKTTLLKHLSYTMVQEINGKGLDDYLPVLIFLRDFDTAGYFESARKTRTSSSTVEALLNFYFANKENGLDLETVRKYCRVGKTIFLLDGLDEIGLEFRNIVVNSFADFRINYKGNKIVLSGRPHGMEGAASERFGNKHVRIQTLNMEQAEEFIKKWFDYVYARGSRIGAKTAKDMIGEVRAHASIERLIDNPLMLTAICILYHDGKELPGQRAELYKKFIANLLSRRFDAAEVENVLKFLKTLAFGMHSAVVTGVDKVHAIKTMTSVYGKEADESPGDYRQRLESLFEKIEPQCGLLKLEGEQYSFWHLTFQEFLTAAHIIDNETEYVKAIESYWDDDDLHREVIELYIGYLSMENRGWANKIVQEVLDSMEKKPFRRWRLAARSMLDIQKDRRDVPVVNRARQRLMSIIEKNVEPEILIDAGETLGWLGDPRNLRGFIPVKGGKYTLSRRTAKINLFEMGKCPVTNKWFEEFIESDGYKNRDFWSDEGKRWLDYAKAEQPRLWNERKWKCPTSPVVGVTWYEADAFTRWLTLMLNDGYHYRLPDEDEWEAAAAGFEGRRYPWGDEWNKNKCNSGELAISRTSPVGIFKEGNTPEGIFDLSGNVWEWTLSDYNSNKKLNDFIFDEGMHNLSKKSEKERQLPAIRGGSWLNTQGNAWCAFRSRLNPDSRYNFIGFRCVRTKK